MVPGIFLVFVAAGAAVTGLATLLFPAMPLIGQVAIFTIGSSAAVAIGRGWYLRNPGPNPDPLLNDRAGRLIGQVVTVAEAIQSGRGKVRVGDSEWLARGPDAPAGAQVRILSAEGTLLSVEPVIA
ncbi:MAG: NfeD family protein [Sphingomonadales bacterium]|nr:MAG: NfeD family protein [Sphingomonadales bacterium]